MKREQRYIVMKVADITSALDEKDKVQLGIIAARVDAHRENRGALPLECVVVERDWPEYEPTWKAIEARVDAAQCAMIATIIGFSSAVTEGSTLADDAKQDLAAATARADISKGGNND